MNARRALSRLRPRPAAATSSHGRSAWLGAWLGGLTTLILAAPASWLAQGLDQLSDGRLRLASPQGTVWQGSALLSLSGGQGSRDAVALPGRLHWQLRPDWQGLRVRLDAACCTPGGLHLRLQPRWGGAAVQLEDGRSLWPAAILSGLGTPWNTLQPEGELQLSSRQLQVDLVQGRVMVSGSAQIEAHQMASRLSTLRPMGSYRFRLEGGAVTSLRLETIEGALQLSGQGQWAGKGLRFEGAAWAEPEREAALSNLLNIIGRRDGARSLITVG